ncbi:BolA family protein [Falsihalocynthiibacter arcticus]|uniref:BolA family transcriptional regulator n=1 Tax=Falsihalocynthiibacter arcticus TaxID=1579316 RepID=A0A126V4L0_9RHOB|nr:BolA family protein [Falsihalocynthiibacter arcticus]AML53248.1 BolA family transcriptional regulator [Falsihalocynthiibacter arcticus]
MSIENEITAKLAAEFAPVALEVINESHLHAGHSGDDGSGESHFRVVIQSAAFTPMSRVARHRAVHTALGKDLVARIHALSLDITPVA